MISQKEMERFNMTDKKESIFWESLKVRDDYNILLKAKKDGIVKYFNNGKNIGLTIKDCILGKCWNWDLRFLNVDPYTFYPKIWFPTYSSKISKEDFFWFYTLYDYKNKDLLIDAKNKSLIIFCEFNDGHCGISIKDCIFGLYWEKRIRDLPKNISLDFFTNFYPKIWNEKYSSKITREDFIIFYCLKNSKNQELFLELFRDNRIKYNKSIKGVIYFDILCVDTYNYKTIQYRPNIKYSKEFFLNFKENYKRKRSFIEDYSKSKKYINSNDFNLFIYQKPIKLTLKNLNLIENNSIVFDIYSLKNKKSIYVGESKNGLNEIDALEMYINHDKEGTKKRRSESYNYGENQPIIDKIWDYDPNFIVRLLAIGDLENPKSVRAFESVWNTESNNFEGCIIKQ